MSYPHPPAFAAGERLLRDQGQQLELATLLCQRARLEVAAGEAARARELLAEAESIAVEIGTGADSELIRALERARKALG